MSRYNVRKKHNKFLTAFDTGIEHLEEKNFNHLASKSFNFQTAVVNSIWQSWNSFWRTYWLAEILGGMDINNNKIPPYNPAPPPSLLPALSEEEAVSFLVNGKLGGRVKPWKEPTWGSIKTLSDISKNMYKIDGKLFPTIPISIKAQNISSAMSLLGNSVDHLQNIRNWSIHLSAYNAKQVSTISVYYSLPTYKYPTDLVFAKTIIDGKKAIVSWQEELTTLLTFV